MTNQTPKRKLAKNASGGGNFLSKTPILPNKFVKIEVS